MKGWRPQTLLDTYTAERHPVGAWAIRWATAQLALMGPKRRELSRTSVVAALLGTGIIVQHILPIKSPVYGNDTSCPAIIL